VTSISRQLIFWLAIPLMLMALCGALVQYINGIAPSVVSSDRRLKETSALIMSHLVFKDGAVILNNADLPGRADYKFAVRDPQGRLLSGDPQVPNLPMDGQTGQLYSVVQIEQRSLRMLTTRFDSRDGVVIISVADTHSSQTSEARYSFIRTLLWDFVQLDVTLVLVWIGIQVGLRPVKRLRDEIAQRSPLDLRPILESTAPREIAPVVVTLNRLFAALRAGSQSQQEFIANTAHQLRTPITGIQAQLDVLAAEPAAQPIRERVQTLQEGIRQLAHTSNQLLTLARADPSAHIASKSQAVDLGTLAGDIAARYFDRALRANIDLGVDASSVSISADPSLIDDLLGNLLDNALKYTPAGGQVTVSVAAPNNKATIAVEDSGPGIPEQDRQRVRERFYRLPNSPGHGSGLGLAIVDEIARLYGATLVIASSPAGGTRISVQFPLAATAPRARRTAN
jgi:two-component system, OmpR family, sensor histidine kinase TctE